MRRGDIRRAVLSALEDGPAHGYEVMRRLEERSGGIWRPSPGSVYPTLQMLEDEGLVRSRTQDGTRVYELTDAGRAEAEVRRQRAPGRRRGSRRRRRRADSGRSKTAVGQAQIAARQVATPATRSRSTGPSRSSSGPAGSSTSCWPRTDRAGSRRACPARELQP